jgi:hypothetical protein
VTRRLIFGLVLLGAAGCGAEPTLLIQPTPTPPAPIVATGFDPAACGTITGRVTWPGAMPEAPTYLHGVPAADGNFVTRTFTGPNQPRIDAKMRWVSGAVVFIRGVDPARCRPWDHPPVRVEVEDRTIRVRQGNRDPDRVGFVRRGDEVEVVSRDPVYHVLRGRGADYFGLALPDRERVRTRAFREPGRVELSCGAGYYWASADHFVTDHPYWTITDAAGQFVLPQVPVGSVELVVWHPGWVPARQDRDPETGLVSRMTYSPAVDRAEQVEVAAGSTRRVELTLP